MEGRAMKDRPRYDSDFISAGTRCEGWLFLPQGVAKPPVVVMAHGFAAEKIFGMTPFARAFLQRGIATFLFDYRNFGGSDGEPRNLVNPWRHLRDWREALRHVRSHAPGREPRRHLGLLLQRRPRDRDGGARSGG
ncbi:MAG: alpha/beta hydrolase [Candidatus Geothermincolia bacterium]